MQNKILLCLFFLTTRLDCQELFPPNQAAMVVIAGGNPMFDNPVNGARRAQQEEARKEMFKQGYRAAALACMAVGLGVLAIDNNQRVIPDFCGFFGLQFLIKSNENGPLKNPDESLLTTSKEIAIKWGVYQVAAFGLEQLSPDLFFLAPLLKNSLMEQYGPSKVALGLLATIKVIDAYSLNHRYSMLDPLSRSLCAYQLAGIIPLQFTRSSVVELLYPQAVDLIYTLRDRIRPA